MAAVAVADGASFTLEDAAAHCVAEGLARQKTPVEIRVVGAIPRNPMGKILKQELRDGWPS